MSEPDSVCLAEFAALVETRTGFVLSASLQSRLFGLLKARAAEMEGGSVSLYVQRLAEEQQPEYQFEFQRLVNAFTVGKTSFFRYPQQIDFLVGGLVPELHRTLPAQDEINIWSVASSTGDEIYSIAMALEDAGWFGNQSGRRLRLLASDINTEVLAVASGGHMSPARYQTLPDRARTYVVSRRGEHRIHASIRNRIEFARINLHTDELPRPPSGWHIIVAANVLIYFSEQNVLRAMERFVEVMAPMSALILGGAEVIKQSCFDFAMLKGSSASAYVRGAWPGAVGRDGLRLLSGVGTEDPVSGAQDAVDVCLDMAQTQQDGNDDAALASALQVPVVPRSASDMRIAGHIHSEPDDAAEEVSGSDESDELAPILAMARRGDSDGAISRLVVLNTKRPQEPAHTRLLALLLVAQGRLDDSLEVLEDAISCDPLSFDLHFYHGFVHYKRHRYAAAADALRRALFLEPTFAFGRYQFALTLHTTEDFEAACREYRRAGMDLHSGGYVTELARAPYADAVEIPSPTNKDLLSLINANCARAEQGDAPL